MNEVDKIKKIECLVYSKVTGYISPVVRWNDGKKQEFSERSKFTEKI